MAIDVRRKLEERLARESGPFAFRENGPFRVCLVYPNTYAVGMSNLGLQVNYRAINEVAGVTCERAFLPDPAWDTGPGRGGRAPVLSMETRRPLSDFHVVAFSITYELDYLNVVRILDRVGIPALKERRRPGSPLILAGGAAPTANPATLSDLVDVFWIGESEAHVSAMIEALAAGWGSPDLLAALARLPHVHVPGINAYRDVYTGIRQFDLDRHPAVSQLLTPDTVFASTGLIEVTRGCKWPCRFCIARTLYGPVRKLSRPVVESYARRIGDYTRKLGLFGAGISDYEGLDDLIVGLAGGGFEVGVSSLRIAAMTPRLLDALHRAGQRTVTVAPESFSQRILRRMAKGVNHVLLHRGLSELARSSMERVKTYLMVGIPGEDESDLALARQIIEPYARKSRCTWELSYSILEPKPHTPFESFRVASRAEIEARLSFLRRDLARVPRVKLSVPGFRETVLCDYLCRGDADVGREIVAQIEGSGSGRFQLPYARYLEATAGWTQDRRAPWALTADGRLSPPPFEERLPIAEPARMPGPEHVTGRAPGGAELPAM
jgi:radical SAM superfamily enzyme YgiQ (UPF0313 family)